MKRNLTIALLICAFLSVAQGQTESTQPPQLSKTEQEVMTAAQEWMDAMKQQDEAKLKSIMAEEYTLSNMMNLSRPPVPKAKWIENNKKLLKVTAFSFDKTRVRVYDSTATVHTLFNMKGTFQDKPVDETFILIDTWVKRNGRWQVASRISGPYKEPQAAK
jgi:ketosteroid isomerase-like protein